MSRNALFCNDLESAIHFEAAVIWAVDEKMNRNTLVSSELEKKIRLEINTFVNSYLLNYQRWIK